MAWSGYDIVTFVKELGPERFLFGSGYPFRDPVSAQIRLSILTELDQQTREAIWGGNAVRLLPP
jgi:predicted TIM-barrel fold metal-dependent hydrolase